VAIPAVGYRGHRRGPHVSWGLRESCLVDFFDGSIGCVTIIMHLHSTSVVQQRLGTPSSMQQLSLARTKPRLDLLMTMECIGRSPLAVLESPLKQDADEDRSIPDPAVDADSTVRAGHDEHPPEQIAAAIETAPNSTTDSQAEPDESPEPSDEITLPSHQEVVGGERQSNHVESVRLFCDLVTRVIRRSSSLLPDGGRNSMLTGRTKCCVNEASTTSRTASTPIMQHSTRTDASSLKRSFAAAMLVAFEYERA